MFPIQDNTKQRPGDKKREIESQKILSDNSSLRYLVRFTNCHECPVASGLGNLTIRYHAQLFIFFTLGYTTTLSLLEIILLEIAFPKGKLALFTWTPKEEPADQIKKEIVTARFIELVPKSAM